MVHHRWSPQGTGCQSQASMDISFAKGFRSPKASLTWPDCPHYCPFYVIINFGLRPSRLLPQGLPLVANKVRILGGPPLLTSHFGSCIKVRRVNRSMSCSLRIVNRIRVRTHREVWWQRYAAVNV